MPSMQLPELSRPLVARAESAPSHESRRDEIYGFIYGFVPLAFVVLCLRLYARWRFAKLGWDDFSVAVSFILYLGLVIATVQAVKYGLGLHIWDVPPETAISMQKCGFSSQVLYPSSLGAVKLSIVLFLLRTLPPDHVWRKPLYGLGAWIACSEGAFTISLFLQCRPLHYYWDKTTEGTCFNQQAFYYVDAALNMATDVVILSIPWFIFRKLNISSRRKYELLLLCSVGVFTLVSSIIRLPYLYDLNRSQDPTWNVPDIVIWSIAELGSAITLSSVPAVRPLIAHIFPRIMEATTRGRGSGGASYLPSEAPTKGSRYGQETEKSLSSHTEFGDGESRQGRSHEFILTPRSAESVTKSEIGFAERGPRNFV